MFVKIKKIEEFSDSHIEKWVDLFHRCFGNSKEPERIWKQKYVPNNGYVGYIELEKKFVASYTILLDAYGRRIGLSVDTMSDGSVRHATSVICDKLYPFISNSNCDLLLGFPNQKITEMRVKHLGWHKGGTLYFKFYFCSTKQLDKLSSFSINRKSNTFYSNTMLHKALEIIFKTKIISLEASLVRFDGGINVASRDWYYKILAPQGSNLIKELRYDSIDVP